MGRLFCRSVQAHRAACCPGSPSLPRTISAATRTSTATPASASHSHMALCCQSFRLSVTNWPLAWYSVLRDGQGWVAGHGRSHAVHETAAPDISQQRQSKLEPAAALSCLTGMTHGPARALHGRALGTECKHVNSRHKAINTWHATHTALGSKFTRPSPAPPHLPARPSAAAAL